MRKAATSLLIIHTLFAGFSSAFTSIACDQDIVIDKTHKYDLSRLDLPHVLQTSTKDEPPLIENTTWTVNICRPIKKDSKIPDADQCASGTNICGVVKGWNPADDPDKKNILTLRAIEVAGSYGQDSGHTMNPQWTRLQKTDTQAQGLQLELAGRKYGKLNQKAVINFECDHDRTGNEGTTDDKTKRDDDEKITDPSLTFVSYGPVDIKGDLYDVLRLNWKTKYVCEDYKGDDDDAKKAGWGFFTWFILIAFLSIAAYLIFGSWLNYNRYGARGWDLLPHGDTIRDVPYLVKDWSRKVIDTVSGPGSRGGYSAV